jgi:uncharacterized peroxidase-related enzyme
MTLNHKTGLPIIEEDEATPEVARIYTEARRAMHQPNVPNIIKSVAVSPVALKTYWAMARTFYENTTLPDALVSMVLYAVAHSNDCQYCSAGHEANCRMMGVDEEILFAIAGDLAKLSPERVRVIIEFAVMVSLDPKSVSLEQYEQLRSFGISDAEIVEIVMVAGMGRLGDTLADSLKVEVDESVREALGR